MSTFFFNRGYISKLSVFSDFIQRYEADEYAGKRLKYKIYCLNSVSNLGVKLPDQLCVHSFLTVNFHRLLYGLVSQTFFS